ncbi:MAG TPA: DUF1849 family protein, partial [Reyranella sp.]|nr:DUF1849 family protein [Reyranella sp.]
MARRVAFLMSLLLTAASAAHAEPLASHSVVYDVKLAPGADKLLYVEGQGSVTFTRQCQGRTLGEIFQFGLEKGESAAPKSLSAKAERLEERVTAEESLDGTTLSYQSRLRLNARLITATGKATLGSAPGKLVADLVRYKQNSDLPAGTLAPAAAREALVAALIANKPDPIEVRTVEMLRFHKPIRQIFTRLQPTDTSIATTLPKDLKVSNKDFAQGRLWALRRQVPEFNELGDELWL